MSNKDFMRDIAFNASRYAKEKEYWLNKLAGRLVRSSFPYDINQDGEGQKDEVVGPIERMKFKISDGVFEKLMWIVNKSDLRLFMVLVAGLVVLLSKHTGQEDIIVGAPIERQEVEGNFLNTILALRAQLDADMTFKGLLLQVRQTLVEAGENLNFPIQRIPYELDLEVREKNVFALFDTAILLENLHDRNYIAHIPLNMVFSFLRTSESIEGAVEYNAALYKKETVQGITDHFVHLFREVVSNLDTPIAKLNILPENEREYLLVKLNDTGTGYPKTTIHELFEIQEEKTPVNIAVEEADTGRTLTYKELNRRANRLAIFLKEKGVIPGAAAAVLGERTADIVISILAILKAGGVFLPLDGQNPDERLRFILDDSGPRIIISQERIIREREIFFKGFSQETIIAMDDESIYKSNAENPRIAGPSTDPAYIIYTSGTTGKPKGVMVEHKSLVNYIRFATVNYVREEAVNFPLYTSIAFDLTITSIFTPLVTGNAVVVYSGWNKGNLIERIIDDNKVGVVKLTPSHLYLIGEKKITGSPGKIRRFVIGGEVLKYQIARDINDNFNGKVEIYNEYGPTEATVGCMLYKFDTLKDRERGNSVPIGVPAANTQIYLLDKNRQPVPIGAVGEIHIGGDGLARGYLNHPELTSEKFLFLSYRSFISPKKKLYRTGDLARYLNDGNMEFLGRMDHQVKIRGFRIELGEIESRLLQYKAVKEAVLTIKEITGGDAYEYKSGDSHLCAYIVSGTGFSVSELREYLAGKLPDYMIPSYFIRLDAIPLTTNGKVDMKALPEPEIKAEAVYIAPRDETEKKLVEIWSEILGLAPGIIGVNANFFELGGHSLSGTVLVAKIHKALDVKLALVDLFRLPTIRELARHLEKSGKIKFTPIEPVEKKEYYPLSSPQYRFYILQEILLNSTAYNICTAVQLDGEPGKENLENTFKKLIDRHESLRTSYFMIGEKPVQKIHKNAVFKIEYYHASESETGDIIQNFIRPFDLSQAPLLRVGLIKIEEFKNILLVDMHHILTDEVAQDILINNFVVMYNGGELSPLKLHYKDYTEWQRNECSKKNYKQQEEYWLKELAGEIPVLNLPTDFSRPPIQSFEGNVIGDVIGEEETRRLYQIALSQGATLFMTLLATFVIFLSKLSGQDNIIVGTPIIIRNHVDLEKIIGMFANTIALTNTIPGEQTIEECLIGINERTIEAFKNQDYLFDDLVEKITVERDMSRNPVFDVMFNYVNNFAVSKAPGDQEIKNSKWQPYPFEHKTAKFDLELSVIEIDGKILFSFEYCTKLFKKDTVERFTVYFKKIVSTVVNEPGKRLWEIEVMSDAEKNLLLYEFNDTETKYPKDKTILRWFEDQVKQTPDYIALDGCMIEGMHGKRGATTYKELNRKSDRLAHMLIEKGVQHDTVVGIMMERSVDMIIGILGVLKSGGAYLPIDPWSPRERIDYMLKDSSAQILLTANEITSLSTECAFTSEAFLNTSERRPFTSHHSSFGNHQPSNLAYVIYTSGSTGKPKGAMVDHRGMMNHIGAKVNDLQVSRNSAVAQNASHTFDISVWQFLAALTRGGKTVIYPDKVVLNPDHFISRLIHDQITILEVVPSYLSLILSSINEKSYTLPHLEYLLVTGEELKPHLVKQWFERYPGIKIVNAYGPTEASDDITHQIMDRVPDIDCIPIGKPLQNMKIYIVDNNMQLCPIGIKGEIWVSGIGVGRGYLNNAELTAEKFKRAVIRDSSLVISSSKLSPNDQCPMSINRLYKTGDLGRWLPDGSIEFFGRKDYQVKIHGFRIELGEIETHILNHPAIKEAVVIDRTEENGDKYLCAYIVPGREYVLPGLREYLLMVLPDYMIPSYFVQVDKIPLTPNGKLDRKALPGPGRISLREDIDHTLPTSDVEKKLVEIWEKVLGRSNIGINENFFMMGGDSIKSILVISRMRNAGYKLEIRDVFQYPVISDLAPRVKKIKRIPEQAVTTGTIALTPIQQDFFSICPVDAHHYNQSVLLYSEERIKKEITGTVFRKLQEHHDALRMTYRKEEGKIIQTNHGLDYPLSIQEYDLHDKENPETQLENICSQIQATIDLENGPLMKIGLFHMEKGDNLFVVIHHLVIDGVSWRILLEDMEAAFHHYLGDTEDQPVVFPLKTDSYKYWSEKLYQYSTDSQLLKQLDYWREFEALPISSLPVDYPVEPGLLKKKYNDSVNIYFTREETGRVLTEIHHAYNTEINDILLTALALSFNRWSGMEYILISLEGHGREEISGDIDIIRTIGWFTTKFPVILHVPPWDNKDGPHNLGEAIKINKERLRKIPSRGFGYGILRYLTPAENKKELTFTRTPQITFNYMGQFGQENTGNAGNAPGIEKTAEKRLFSLSPLSTGNTFSPEQPIDSAIDISGIIIGNQLNFTFGYNTKQYNRSTIETIAHSFKSYLQEIIQHCGGKEETEKTLSDYSISGMEEKNLENVYDALDELFNS